jgi:hypothetical protein
MKYTTYRTNKNCDAFEMLNVKEQEKCAKCKTISTKKVVKEETGCQVMVCEKCGHDEFYIFKEVNL